MSVCVFCRRKKVEQKFMRQCLIVIKYAYSLHCRNATLRNTKAYLVHTSENWFSLRDFLIHIRWNIGISLHSWVYARKCAEIIKKTFIDLLLDI